MLQSTPSQSVTLQCYRMNDCWEHEKEQGRLIRAGPAVVQSVVEGSANDFHVDGLRALGTFD